jgi:hypothetical protein
MLQRLLLLAVLLLPVIHLFCCPSPMASWAHKEHEVMQKHRVLAQQVSSLHPFLHPTLHHTDPVTGDFCAMAKAEMIPLVLQGAAVTADCVDSAVISQAAAGGVTSLISGGIVKPTLHSTSFMLWLLHKEAQGDDSKLVDRQMCLRMSKGLQVPESAAHLHSGEGCLCMFFCWGALLDLHWQNQVDKQGEFIATTCIPRIIIIIRQKEGAPLHCVCNYYAHPKLAQDTQKCS